MPRRMWALMSLAVALARAGSAGADDGVRAVDLAPENGPPPTVRSGSGPRVVEVYPTGQWPRDVQNVQAAVDAGGTVRLKAVNFARAPTAFNFGGESQTIGSVLLNTDVIVVGERTGPARTTIRGGTIPFFGTARVKVAIAGIDFDRPWGGAILIMGSRGLTIADNRITDVAPHLLPVGFTQGDGLDVNGETADAITGSVRIAGNTIRGLTADFAVGMQLDNVSADVVISGNTVSVGQVLGTGSIESDGILTLRCHRSVRISDNAISVGPGMVFDAILIAGDHDARYRVSRNSIVSESPLADGILVNGGLFSEATVSPTIDENTVTMHASSYGAISLYGAVTGGSIRLNRVLGDASYALQGADDGQPDDLVTANVFARNDMSDFAASVADVFMAANTRDNVEAGPCRSFIDDGVNNRFDCGGISSAPRLTSRRVGPGHPERREVR